MNSIVFYLNGRRREIQNPDPEVTLLEYVRVQERLTGSKLGCGEGGCGACTVMVSGYNMRRDRIEHRSVNGCLFPLPMADNLSITTIEGIGNRKGGLHPVQKRMVEGHGSQCGFCTPGIVMSMYTLLRQKCAEGEELTALDVEENFDGNLCRCTGYRPILDAFKTFAGNEPCCGGRKNGKCCRESPESTPTNDAGQQNGQYGEDTGLQNGFQTAEEPDTDSEHVFPRELIKRAPPCLRIDSEGGQWFRPVTTMELKSIMKEFPTAKIICGNTEIGVERKYKNLQCPVLISLQGVAELTEIRSTPAGFEIGAAATLTDLRREIGVVERRLEGSGCETLHAIAGQLKWFAGKQIRNVATVGGNIVTASPISDLNPVWSSSRAQFLVFSHRTGEERLQKAEEFFVGYRKIRMAPGELLLKVIVPWTKPYEFVSVFKASRRRDDDIAIVTTAIRISLARSKALEPGWNISDVSFAFGGVAEATTSPTKAERSLTGSSFDEATMERALQIIGDELQVPKGAPGGMAAYRSSVVVGFVFKAFLQTAEKLRSVLQKENVEPLAWEVDERLKSIISDEKPQITKGVQVFDKDGRPATVSAGKPVGHVAAELHVSGEAVYVDDMPVPSDCLFAALVLSTKPHARIKALGVRDALEMNGVVDIVTAADIPGRNAIGVNLRDELCFAVDEVTCTGQVIALTLANSQRIANKAAKAVVVEYECLPSIITIEDAIDNHSYLPGVKPRLIEHGDVDIAFKTAEHVARGDIRIGGQEHFYLECNGTVAIPSENDEMTLYISTQGASHSQEAVAEVLGVPQHKVVARVKRLGGAFGGKESRSINSTVAVAVAAKKHNRPVRFFFDRDSDMLSTGTRHPFYGEYSVAFDGNGRLKALDVKIYNNAGNSRDLSHAVIERAVLHVDNAYNIPNVRVEGRCCYTHTPSNTAFRGFGGPQGMLVGEQAIEHVANYLRIPAEAVRFTNLYREGDVTPYGMKLTNCTIRPCWNDLTRKVDVDRRRIDIEAYNKANRYNKRGLSVAPVKFGISFVFKTLNQAGALVHVYLDGSVLVTHGGIEMGQGLHTKMIQVAATAFGLPIEKVFISETATDKVPNATPSAASASADMYGMAVKNACDQIEERLKPVREALGKDPTWEQLVERAYAQRINLSAQGFYRVPDLDSLDLSKAEKGRPFYYFTYGAAASEVEIDCLTGDHKVLYSEIVMDVGRSLNPAIDIGQIEGAFVQGMGWCTMEELVRGGTTAHRWLPTGFLSTQGPGTYKIPGFRDIPRDFRVSLLKDAPNLEETIHQSKAVGEPPLFLAASVFFAIRDACKSSRQEFFEDEELANAWFELDSPATTERIRMACADEISSRFADPQSFRAEAFI
ncbi:hypothetical protein NDN08_004739 [Rhodosorus marinus]|uniref:xanthine dehydrogenase n=1 Tax=Rhodosorus marinus TaxID=101924 RepID=A0AAV8URA2_9RHOD|nr:hypothetical protein NDN08_004739 [Rhodosorus marinus]